MTKSRIKDNTCPHCLSKLIDEEGRMVCTGSRLQIWEGDFKKYKTMDIDEKRKFLISYSDSEKFIDLYDKWAFVNADGLRPNFTCDYTNQIFAPLPDNRLIVPDPLQVKGIERKLKRTLTASEINGDTEIVVNGKLVELKRMIFPDDF